MKPLNVLVTGAGAPGIAGTIYSLRNNYDNREMRIVGTDVKEHVVGRFLCDDFLTIPPSKDTDKYFAAIKSICKGGTTPHIDIMIPQNTAELLFLSQHKAELEELGTRVLVSDHEPIVRANDKYNLFEVARAKGVPTSKYGLCEDFSTLSKLVEEMKDKNGYAVVKPPLSNGSRGIRIVCEHRDRKADFYNEKPNSLYVSLDELHGILGETFPKLIVMEYLPGDEYTVDVFRNGNDFCAIPRKREVIRSGITFAASLSKDFRLIDYSRKLADACGLSMCFGFQFKMNEREEPILLECNPRVQGTMVMSTFCGANVIYSSVKALLGETIPSFDIDWDTTLLRYWGALGIHGAKYDKV